MSKQFRMSRIFNSETGNTLILPIDHGIAEGSIKGLENPQKVLANLMTPDIDGVLMTDGIAKKTESVFYGKHSPARLLTADAFQVAENHMYHELAFSIEKAAARGYDCIKLILFWDRPAEERMKSIQIISETVQEAEKWGIPVLVEPLTYEPVEDEAKRIKLLADGSRIAYELGADILKVPHPGNLEALQNWVEDFDVPIIMLGGGMAGGLEELTRKVEEAISVGVKGVAIGRNVWQRPSEDAKKLLSDFADIVHKRVPNKL